MEISVNNMKQVTITDEKDLNYKNINGIERKSHDNGENYQK